jgi:hypothetical protein
VKVADVATPRGPATPAEEADANKRHASIKGAAKSTCRRSKEMHLLR